ncbi:hypothetical protein SAMN06295912_1615 [Sphingomonas laterariae]|uniref:Uncharacterized protein n=1 Tax=Edaphosphingomonas laterariae TaxID=861865 RepID=A0A239KVD9_9SPHN|nr:hypothetical protein SAMN06295912_1615 [Sphingomonas laterariae]
MKIREFRRRLGLIFATAGAVLGWAAADAAS